MKKLIPTILNCANIRSERQKINNMLVYNAIKLRNIKEFNSNINKEELKRVLDECGITQEEFFERCYNDDILCRVSAGRISKCASRQGSKDEKLQIHVCNTIATQCGINIENLIATAYRPTKGGRIISDAEMKKEGIKKDECLKSFDAKITGKMNGWLIAKITYDEGGHQDNVFEELDVYCAWVSKYNHVEDSIKIMGDTH